MNKRPLNFYLQEAQNQKQAIGHFNFVTADVLRAIVQGSKEARAKAVMVGTSEGEADFLGLKETVALVRATEQDYDFPVFLNADHFKSFERCKQAIDEGFDSIIIDASRLPLNENMVLTKQVLDYAKTKNPDISVEGELGYLRGASQVQIEIKVTPDDYTKPLEAKAFVKNTGIDRLAIVFGNIHGVVTKQEERLDFDVLNSINQALSGVYLVLHGASGLPDQQIKEAIRGGIVNIHFNTELRVVYRKKLEEIFYSQPSQTTPYKYLQPSFDAVKELIRIKTSIFINGK